MDQGNSQDPLQKWWTALERGGYRPHGDAWDFRSFCPLCPSLGHAGNNPFALHVFVDADGRATPHCFVCNSPYREIARAVGLHPSDSYPPGHRRARRFKLAEARRSDFVGAARSLVDVIYALETMGESWSGDIHLHHGCPYCGALGALIHADSRSGAFLSCPGDEEADALGYRNCTLDQAEQALAARLEDEDDAA